MKLRLPFQIFLLCIIVLCIYYPTLSAEISLVDDKDAISGFFNSESLTIKDIFLPRTKDGGYYRPLIGLLYLFDKSVWDLGARGMHLDNILIHLINSILVFFISRLSCKDNISSETGNILPFVAGLLFALHPVNTESVNWISGRTDPMAAVFLLSASIFLLLYRKSSDKIHLVFVIILVLSGVLAKETSLGMLLAVCFIILAHKSETICLSGNSTNAIDSLKYFFIFYAAIILQVIFTGNYWLSLALSVLYAVYLASRWSYSKIQGFSISTQLLKLSAISSICLLMIISTYTLLRRFAFKSDVSKISHTVKLMIEDTNYAISLFLGASGFYVKKFFIPLPLNFFILEIDPLYDFLGIAVLLFCIYLITRLSLASAFFLSGVCMFLPALPFAFGTIAWTGYAERYIYISSAFWVVSIAIYMNTLLIKHNVLSKLTLVSSVILILFFGWQTYSRNIVWQKNTTLLADTVNKNPKQPLIREMYMQALINSGQYEMARQQYIIGKSKSIFISEGPDLLMAQVLIGEGKYNEAFNVYEKTLFNSNYTSERALKGAIALIERMSYVDKSPNQVLIEKKAFYESKLINISKDPMLFYNMGQKAITRGDKKLALLLFEKANSAFSDGNKYKEYSSRIIMSLKHNINQEKISK